ncbi:MAG: DNA topoisomerase 4 subunit A, partial [Clostridia bacterium]|nr:DNA topoisomerase 4 subunit A [Clostridia bacterium]
MDKEKMDNEEILGKNIDADNIDAIVSELTDEEHEVGATETETKSKRKMLKEQLLVSAGLGKNILDKTLDTVMHESMMPYSEHVILDRALPRVEDGLKPVQRRILYSMLEQGLTPDKPYKKSAKVVGECLGNYHPHGDSSVYDAMARMAQPFNMKECLVDGQGNFGSIDGDSPAAMRYTEARMTPLALEILRDLDKNTVDWMLTYDDSMQEPKTLPCRFPNVLVNGASGIAVGLATNIPTHNLAETISAACALIDNPNITLKEMMKIIKAPDFPTGGYIIAGDELEKAYETGKGKILIRAKTHIEGGEGDKKNIVITEIPYQVNKATLLQKIAELRDSKKDILGGITEISDESDREGMRAVIRVKKDADPKKILEYLFKYTQLQVSFGINMVVIADGRPQQLGLIPILEHYVAYQREVVFRRTKFELDAAKEREHILRGLIIAVRNIDEVVAIIKKSASTTEAKQRLKARFELSDVQAQAILDMRLARLTSLEVFKLETELLELEKKIRELTAIVGSKKLQFDLVKEEMNEIKKKFKDARKSEVIATVDDYVVAAQSDEKPILNVVIASSQSGYIKAMSAKHVSMAGKVWGEKSLGS